MSLKLACRWPSILAAVLAICFPTASAALVADGTSYLRRSNRSSDAKDPEPTPDEAGLFGPPFNIPLLWVGTGKPAGEVQMQLAILPAEEHHGLMFRRSLAEDYGMMFLYTAPGQRVLWMKNTYVPLDAAWFTNDGVLREVHHLHPLDLTYRWTDREDISMGLETRQGYFEEHGYKPGAVKVDLDALSAAIMKRGYYPGQFVKGGMMPPQ
mmetsp:Transcript_89097/g.236713  ORF Transcript_89097/g.236713 Transcript_89097/m.236713 type:complete len:210 (-) Transcript_89097:124-753(-)